MHAQTTKCQERVADTWVSLSSRPAHDGTHGLQTATTLTATRTATGRVCFLMATVYIVTSLTAVSTLVGLASFAKSKRQFHTEWAIGHLLAAE